MGWQERDSSVQIESDNSQAMQITIRPRDSITITYIHLVVIKGRYSGKISGSHVLSR
jgi:hypothetical protein